MKQIACVMSCSEEMTEVINCYSNFDKLWEMEIHDDKYHRSELGGRTLLTSTLWETQKWTTHIGPDTILNPL